MNDEENKKSNSEIIIEKMDEDCNSSQIYKNRLRSVVRNINNKINNSKNNKNVDNNYVDKHKIKKVYKTKKPIKNQEQIHLINGNTDIIENKEFKKEFNNNSTCSKYSDDSINKDEDHLSDIMYQNFEKNECDDQFDIFSLKEDASIISEAQSNDLKYKQKKQKHKKKKSKKNNYSSSDEYDNSKRYKKIRSNRESCSDENIADQFKSISEYSSSCESEVCDKFNLKKTQYAKDKIHGKGFIEKMSKFEENFNNDSRSKLFLEKLSILKKKVILEINNIFEQEVEEIENNSYNETSYDLVNEHKNNNKDCVVRNNNKHKLISKLQLNDKEYYIEVLCINKSLLRDNENSGLRYFIDLKDDTGTIRLIAFQKEEDVFYEKFKINEVFKVYDASVKQINTKFNSIGYKFELRYNKLTKIELVANNNKKIKAEKIKLTTVSEISNKKKGDKINVLAIILKIGDVRSIKSPYKTELSPLRLISIIDISGQRINCSLWNQLVDIFNFFNFFLIIFI